MIPPATRSARVPHLDGLRGVAIAAVLAHHFVPPLLDRTPESLGGYLAAALTLAYTGVDLFFVLSGYLIGGILLEKLASPRLLPTFYLRRCLRILPVSGLAIIALLCARAAGCYATTPEGGAPWPAPVYLFFGSNLWMAAAHDWGYRPLSHFWSLAIEEQFYLVVPALLRWLPSSRQIGFFIGLIVAAIVFRLTVLALSAQPLLTASLLPFGRLDSLGAGMVVAWIMRKDSAQSWCRQHRAILTAALVIAVIGCAVLTKLKAGNASLPMAQGGYTVVAAVFALVLLQLELSPQSWAARYLSFAPLVALGRVSYFAYLFQGLLIGLTIGIFFHGNFAVTEAVSFGQLAVGLLGLFVVAAASWRWLEAPLIRLGHRHSY